MNNYIIGILLFQIGLCLFLSMLNFYWNTSDENHFYLEEDISPSRNSIYRFLTYFILLNTMIPISLIVSLELVKVAQAYFITNDEKLYVEFN
jgi:magnesium-transporting ATPase (P-type)